MPKLMASVLASVLAYVPHWIFGDHMEMMTDFLVSTIVGGVAYVGILWYLKKLRGDF